MPLKYNQIILTGTIFGSIYLFSTSLKNINGMVENNKINKNLILLNGFICGYFGITYLYLITRYLKNN